MRFLATSQGKSEVFDVPDAAVARAHATRWAESNGDDPDDVSVELQLPPPEGEVNADLARMGDALTDIGREKP